MAPLNCCTKLWVSGSSVSTDTGAAPEREDDQEGFVDLGVAADIQQDTQLTDARRGTLVFRPF